LVPGGVVRRRIFCWLHGTLTDLRPFDCLGAKRSPLYPVAGTMAPRLTTMDRIYLAIIASAILLLHGAACLYVTRTADLMPHARTIGAAGFR